MTFHRVEGLGALVYVVLGAIDMEFLVPEMSCGHCTAAIEKTIKQADPAATVVFDLPARRVQVESSLSNADLINAISEAGYETQAAGN